MAIALVTVPPEGGIYILWPSTYTWFGLQRTLWLQPYRPSPPCFESRVTDDRNELFLGHSGLVSMPGGKLSAFRLRNLRLDKDIVFDIRSLLGVPVLSSRVSDVQVKW
jgi:hypothetical protein